MKAPAFQWYPKDCDTDENVRTMDDKEFGFFVRCLNHSWLNNGLPEDLGEVARIMNRTRPYVNGVWARVGRCFEAVDGRFYNPKQEALRKAQGAFGGSRAAELGSKGGAAKWGQQNAGSLEKIDSKNRYQRLLSARSRGTHTQVEWQKLLAALNFSCARCGSKDSIQKDHVTIIAHGGSDAISNIQPLCKRCNSGKGPDNTDYVTREFRLALGHILPSESLDEKTILPSSASASASALKREEYSELEVRVDEPKLPVSSPSPELPKLASAPLRTPSPVLEGAWYDFRKAWSEHSKVEPTDTQWSIANGIFRHLDPQQQQDAIAGVGAKAAADSWKVIKGVPNNYLASKVWTLKDKPLTPPKTLTKAPHAMIIPSWEEVSAEKARAFQRETERNRGIFWHEGEEASGTETHRAS